MDELQLLLNKNKLHILLIKVMHDINKGNAPKSKLDALETLKIANKVCHLTRTKAERKVTTDLMIK